MHAAEGFSELPHFVRARDGNLNVQLAEAELVGDGGQLAHGPCDGEHDGEGEGGGDDDATDGDDHLGDERVRLRGDAGVEVGANQSTRLSE